MASFPEKVLQSHELLQVNQLGVDVVAISKLAVGQWKGYGLFTFVRDTEGWKIRMAYVSTLVGNNRSSEQWTCSALRRSSARDMMSFWAHGMGIISHGAPWLTSNALPTYPAYHADKPLEVGMVISIETELHHNTRGFIKLEDTVAITDTGWEAFGDEGWNICGS